MAIEAFERQNCSISRTLAFLGERWTVLVLREIFLGNRRFDAIQSQLGVATNVLSERLGSLVDEGILERRPYSDHPQRFEYRLTEKGRELQPVLLTLLKWGDRYKAPNGPPVTIVHEDCGHEAEGITVCSHCGGEMHARNIHAEPGPGASAMQRKTGRLRAEARSAA